MKDKDSLTLIVLEPELEGNADDGAGLPEDTVELQGVRDKLLALRSKPKQVKLSALRERMEEVQDEVGELLGGLGKSTGGYRLSEVQVSLAISGSGSIGVATVGAEAAISLVFAAPTE